VFLCNEGLRVFLRALRVSVVKTLLSRDHIKDMRPEGIKLDE
jgi:hypothetical protein